MKIGNAKLGQDATKKQLPWYVCIYHKYEILGEEYFEQLAFEPKAYNEEDNLLADSSFGFRFSELSYEICPNGLLEMYDRESKRDINKAAFYNVDSYLSPTPISYEVDFIECKDQALFEYIMGSDGFFVQDVFKDHDNDRENSSKCVVYGLQSKVGMYDLYKRWDNGLIGHKRG